MKSIEKRKQRLFIVSRHGVYDQGIVGVFSSQKNADEAMNRAKREERDDYHSFYVCTIDVDQYHQLEYDYKLKENGFTLVECSCCKCTNNTDGIPQ